MSKDLTNSAIDRQNILNNPYALAEIEKAAGVQGIPFEGKTVVLKEQVAAFFEVTPRTIDNYIEKCGDELRQNGYEVLKGNRLKTFKLSLEGSAAHESGFVTKTTALGVFDFRSFLNLAMLVSESERAKLLRQAILDIVIDTINSRTGGGTKYINQRDEDFLHSAFVEENYRKQFTDALKDCVALGQFKYAVYTDKIYVSIFREKAHEYRKILKLENRDNV
ncbi:MAG: DNA-binding protein, partial [Pseudolabrys sp.]|nr:DNA-binding protein [Pseudolabrys sp.]